MPDAAVSGATPFVPPQNLPYPPQSGEDRDVLLRFIREAPLVHGSWNQFKSLYKTMEADTNCDPALFAAMIARIEDAPAGTGRSNATVDLGDIAYVQSCAAVGEYFFVIGSQFHWNEKLLTVFQRDPSDARKVTVATSLSLLKDHGVVIESVVVCGSLLCYVMRNSHRSDNKTLRIVDISDPQHPRLRGKWATSGTVTLSQSADTYPYLYLTVTLKPAFFSGNSELHVIDLSYPDAPSVVGKTVVDGLANALDNAVGGSVAVSGALAVCSFPPRAISEADMSHKGGLRFVDVSNPKSPRVVGNLLLETAASVAVRGIVAYVSVRSRTPKENGLQVVDLSDPRAPRLAGFCPLSGRVGQITLSPDGRSVYVDADRALHTVNIGDPARPARTGTVKGLGTPELALAGGVAYLPSLYHGIRLLSLTRPETPHFVTDAPGGETIGYMKRRGRRFLRQLAKTNPARYAETATELLLAMTGKDAAIDTSRHWATIDVLFGGGTRFRQTKHGRGRYIATGQVRSRLALRTREERAPGAWETRPDLLSRLLQTPDLMLPVQTFAARALRATGNVLPPLPDIVLEQWLASTEPLLVALAVKSVTERLLGGENLSPTITADAFYKSDATVRQTLTQTRGSGWAGNKRWAETFAERLAAYVPSADRVQTGLSKRKTAVALLLARYFSWAIAAKTDLLLPMVAPLLATGRPELQSLIVAGAAHVTSTSLLPWIVELARVTEQERREATLQALGQSLKTIALERRQAFGLVFHAEPLVQQTGWRLLAASTTADEILQEIWTDLLQSREVTPYITTAMASPYALGLLERAGIGAAELAQHIADRPFLAGLLSAEAFGNVAATASAPVVLGLVAASPEANWVALRTVWLRQLREGVGTASIWLAAENALNNDNTERLEARLLGDAEIAETFLTVDDERLLMIREPAFGVLLARWVERYADRFTRNSSLLYDAATHPLPEVRTPALVRVAELGMDMPFALRLVESAVPPSVAVGRSFFDAEATGGDREFDYALALCDSPDSDVRRLGIEYVETRLGTLDQDRVLSALFENPAPEIQSFVAARLGAMIERPAATPVFDGEVLRTTNRARVAKERIKTRQTAEPTVDVVTLLTVARGRTPRDADWALSELARRVAAGEAIDGVTVEGVIGI